MAATYVVQNAGGATISYSYAKALTLGTETLAAGSQKSLTGFKLNSNYLDTQQAIDNSVLIPLLDGGSIQITNGNGAGRMTINAIRTGGTLASGDLVSIAMAQRDVTGGDSIGATIVVTFQFNGTTYTVTFNKCTVVQVKPLTLAGNDAPDYQVVFNYASWSFSSAAAM